MLMPTAAVGHHPDLLPLKPGLKKLNSEFYSQSWSKEAGTWRWHGEVGSLEPRLAETVLESPRVGRAGTRQGGQPVCPCAEELPFHVPVGRSRHGKAHF